MDRRRGPRAPLSSRLGIGPLGRAKLRAARDLVGSGLAVLACAVTLAAAALLAGKLLG